MPSSDSSRHPVIALGHDGSFHGNSDSTLSSSSVSKDSIRLALTIPETGVMTLLFERGHFHHILEKIFFMLDPRSLLACSQVCKEWNKFLEKRIWNTMGGERRILHNWLNKEPSKRWIEMRQKSSSSCHVEGLEERLLVPLGSRPDVPRSVTANDDYIVVAILGTIDLYDRRSLGYIKRLKVADLDVQWHLSMSKNFLVAKQLCIQGSCVEVFDVRRGFEKIAMREKYPKDQSLINSIRMIGDDNLLLEGFSRTSNHLTLFCYRIDRELKVFEWLWSVEEDYSVINVTGDHIVLCGKDLNTPKVRIFLHSVIDGWKLHEMSFDSPGERDVIKGVAYTRPLAVVLMANSERCIEDGWVTYKEGKNRIYLCDMAHGFLLRKFEMDCSLYFGDVTLSLIQMWCDPPIGILLMAAQGKVINSTKILAWNLMRLLREDDNVKEVFPDRVFETGGFALADAIVPFQYKMIYPCVMPDDRSYLVDCNFWGKFQN